MNLPSLLSLSGIAILAAAGLSSATSVLLGAALWIGVAVPVSLPVPPQTLVIGGLFLAVPVAMLGYGLWWAGGWIKHHR